MKCVLVGSAATMFTTWEGAEVQHAPGCDGKCAIQRQLSAIASIRRQSMEQILDDIDDGQSTPSPK